MTVLVNSMQLSTKTCNFETYLGKGQQRTVQVEYAVLNVLRGKKRRPFVDLVGDDILNASSRWP